MQPRVHAPGARGLVPSAGRIRAGLASARAGRALVALAYPVRSWWVVARSGAFDTAWYRWQGGRGRGPAAALHYVLRGRRAGLSPHPLFEPALYDPDTWTEAPGDPFASYLRRGPLRGRPVHPLLDDAALLRRHAHLGRRRGDLLRFAATRADRLPMPAAEHPGPGDRAEDVDRRVALAAVHAAVHGWRAGAGSPPGPAAGPAAAVTAGRTTLLTVVPSHVEPDAARSVADAAAGSLLAADDVEVMVVDDAGSRATAVALAAWVLREPRLRVRREAVRCGRARATGRALSGVEGDVVALARAGTRLEPGWVDATREALHGAAAVQPLLLSETGTLRSVGAVRDPDTGLPFPLLGDHPVEDAGRTGSPVLVVPCLDDAVVVARTEDVRRLDGPDPSYAGTWDLSDLSMRLAGDRGRLVCALSTAATVAPPDLPPGGPAAGGAPTKDAAAAAEDARRFAQRWSGSGRWRVEPWRELGLEVLRWTGSPPAPRVARLQVDERAGGRRWAIRTGAPAGRAGLSWGDVHFARSLAAALERLGQEVVVDGRTAHARSTGYLDDVVLALRGVVPVVPDADTVSLCWVISHPQAVTGEELAAYDGVVAASGPWAERVSRLWGLRVGTLLQCTDPSRFAPRPELAGAGPDVLFVGNSRNVHRPVVRDAEAAGLDLALYGSGWDRFVGPDRVVARYVPNADLARLYASCGVLLNDHWEDMRAEGFMSNRLFDAAATAVRVVTDDIAGTEVFDGLVRPYRSVAELRDLVVGSREAVFPTPEAASAVAARVRGQHSFDARARELVDLAARAERDRR